MSWDVEWTGGAVTELLNVARTSTRQADRIDRAVELLARSEQGDVKKLTDRSEQWRLRVGDWRVIFKYEQAAGVMLVLAVKRRNEGTYRD